MPNPLKLKALVFDAYGTLFDVHSVIVECEALFPGNGTKLSQIWRSKQLEYTWLRSLMDRYEEFEAVTRSALLAACQTLGLVLDQTAAKRLMDAYLVLRSFPETEDALLALRGRKLAILSNGSPRMLNAVVQSAGFDRLFDAVISVDELRIFKPHPSVYALATRYLNVSADEIGFVSSNFWDVAGATSFGFRAFWINRGSGKPDELGYQPVAVLSRLTDLTYWVS